MFEKGFDLSINKGYVSNWGMAHAVRELIQNALDSESPFIYEFRKSESEDSLTLVLKSEDTVLSPSTLLLGATSKANDEHAIGSFGEGYKIALLVLTRLGYKVEMHNADVAWCPQFKFSKQFQDEILHIQEAPLPNKKNKGLTVYVHGLSQQDAIDVIASCLRMQNDVGRISQTPYGDILHDQPGKLYIGSLFICDTKLRFGYNIKPGEVKLERDRQTVDGWDLRTATLKLWIATEDHERIATLIDDGCPDVEYAQWSLPTLIKEECYKLFRARNPRAAVASNQKELEAMIKAGMIDVHVVNPVMYSAVSSAPSYRTEVPRVRQTTPTEQTLDWIHRNRKYLNKRTIIALDELVKMTQGWRAN